GAGIEASGVHDRGVPAFEADQAVEAVAGGAGDVTHERAAAVDETGEERRLAGGRGGRDRDDRAEGRRRSAHAGQRAGSAAPGVGGTAGTGTPRSRARSPGVRSSRKPPSPSRTATPGTRISSPTLPAVARWRWMSRPVSSPATPIPRPKSSFGTAAMRTRSAAGSSASNAVMRGANISPVTTVT